MANAPIVAAAPAPTTTVNTPGAAVNGDSAAAQAAKAVAVEPRYIEVVVDGQPQKYTEAEAKKLLSKVGYSDKMTREAKSALKQIQEARAADAKAKELAKTDKAAFLKAHGIDPEAFAREVLEAKIREQGLTPEQKAFAEQEQNLKTREQKVKEFEAAKAQERENQLANEMQQDMMDQLAAAAQALDFKIDPASFISIEKIVTEMSEINMPWDAERVIEMAREEIDGHFAKLETAVLSGLTGPALLKRVGPKVADAVVKARVEEIRARRGQPPSTQPVPVVKAEKPSDYLSPKQFDEKMKKMGGR